MDIQGKRCFARNSGVAVIALSGLAVGYYGSEVLSGSSGDATPLATELHDVGASRPGTELLYAQFATTAESPRRGSRPSGESMYPLGVMDRQYSEGPRRGTRGATPVLKSEFAAFEQEVSEPAGPRVRRGTRPGR